MSQRLSLYIHIPYCVKRCGYCDFNTYTPRELGQSGLGKSEISSQYIDSAILEIDRASSELADTVSIGTIFFGGGTPSLMEGRDINRILSHIRQQFIVEDDCEITMEANPDSVDEENLAAFVSAGVNRFSFGLQTIAPHLLKTLDRTHNEESILKALEIAVKLGVKNLSADLIYGTPGESMEDLIKTLEFALHLPINHISAYALIVEKGTKLASQISRGEISVPDDDLMADKYLVIDSTLEKNGFQWYELSNWAKAGAQSQHNQVYWTGGNWWGIGPGAHSFLGDRRWWNIKNPISYIAALSKNESVIAESEVLSDENKRDEKIMLKIRMRSGLARSDLRASDIAVIERYINSGDIDLENWEKGAVVLTLSGRLIADRIVSDLVV